MVRYWGSFVSTGRPSAPPSARWLGYDDTGLVMSLRAGGESRLISDAELAAQHNCGFWDPSQP